MDIAKPRRMLVYTFIAQVRTTMMAENRAALSSAQQAVWMLWREEFASTEQLVAVIGLLLLTFSSIPVAILLSQVTTPHARAISAALVPLAFIFAIYLLNKLGADSSKSLIVVTSDEEILTIARRLLKSAEEF